MVKKKSCNKISTLHF